MRGQKTSTELQHLTAGLGSAEDPYQIKGLLNRKPAELAEEVRKEIRYSTLSMIRAGRIFMAIKKQLPHGEWEDFVVKQRWSWNYVRCSMKFLEVVAKFPQALHLPPGRTTDRLLQLPFHNIAVVFDDMPAEAIKKLTPWDLEKIYNDQKVEEEKKRRKPRKQYPDLTDDQLPTELASLVAKALSALNLIAELKIEGKAREKARRFQDLIETAWNRAAYNLKDPEHKTKPWWETHPMHDDVTDDNTEA